MVSFLMSVECGEVAELADAADSKSAVLNVRVGSTPTFATTLILHSIAA